MEEPFGDELFDLADFSCQMYARHAVFLSAHYNTRSQGGVTVIQNIEYLFACAYPEVVYGEYDEE